MDRHEIVVLHDCRGRALLEHRSSDGRLRRPRREVPHPGQRRTLVAPGDARAGRAGHAAAPDPAARL